ncbi:hypothetical protein AcV5_002981 [Taiwanofungus camphoratus]|nr:hypothetical protein AcV5_002981 [Antrodia cinnamomea]
MRPDIIVARGLGPVTWFRTSAANSNSRNEGSACGVNSSLFDFSGRLPCHLGPRHSGHLEAGAKNEFSIPHGAETDFEVVLLCSGLRRLRPVCLAVRSPLVIFTFVACEQPPRAVDAC